MLDLKLDKNRLESGSETSNHASEQIDSNIRQTPESNEQAQLPTELPANRNGNEATDESSIEVASTQDSTVESDLPLSIEPSESVSSDEKEAVEARLLADNRLDDVAEASSVVEKLEELS